MLIRIEPFHPVSRALSAGHYKTDLYHLLVTITMNTMN